MIRMMNLFNLLLLTAAAAIAPLSAETSNTKSEQFGEPLEDWQVRLELAKVLGYQKKYAEAFKEYRAVLASQPNQPEAKIGLAEVLVHMGRQKEANRLLAEIIHSPLDSRDLIRIANLLASSKRYQEAEDLFERYLSEHPGDLLARFQYAEVLSWDKKYTDSIAQYEALLEARPNDRQLRRKYALVLVWKGETEQARRELERTLTAPSL